MCGKSIFLISIVLVLGLSGTVAAELVACWRFDGDFVDATGNGHDGTAFDSAVIVDDTVRRQVLETDNAGRVRVGDAADLNYAANESFSYMVWVNYDPGLVGSGWRTIFAKGRTQDGGGTTYNADVLYGFWVSGSGNWHVGCGGVRADTDPAEAGQWHHLAAVQDGDAGTVTFYIDGHAIPSGGGSAGPCESPDWPLYFGAAGTDQSPFESFGGRIDEAQIYSHALTQEEILSAMEGAGSFPYARRPDPADGALYTNTWVTLSWLPGDFAVSHDVYLGDNFDGVNDATIDSPIFRGNQATPMQIVGFFGFPFPDGLVPGTTYYWRVDEVNDADPNSPWKGSIWSFSILPRKAYEPDPSDNARFILPDATLSWTAGHEAKLHTIYFGDDYDTVANATDGVKTTAVTYSPGTLDPGKKYHWRVDEFNPPTIVKGDVWSFATLPDMPVSDPDLVAWWKLDEGSGTTVIDWSSHGNHGELMGDPEWTDGFDAGALDLDGGGDYVNFASTSDLPSGTSARTLCGWGKADTVAGGWRWIAAYGSAGTGLSMFIGMNGASLYGGGYGDDVLLSDFWEVDVWHHICLTYDGTTAILYADGIQVASEAKSWDLALGRAHIGRQVNDAAEFWNGLVDDVRIYSRVLTPDEIKQVMRGDTKRAWDPNPTNGSTQDIGYATPLTWSPGDNVSEHAVYFGTDKDIVDNADTSDTTGVYRGQQTTTSYSPPEGVEWGHGPYYWRVDEHNTDATVAKGEIWNFTVADYLTVDDFESYDDIDPAPGEPGLNRIFDKWIDGYSKPLINGAIVGNPMPPYAETTIVHSGSQSMNYSYDNAGKTSEATLTLVYPRDWTEQSVTKLSLWLNGGANNAADHIYVGLNGTAVVYHDDPAVTQIVGWNEWVIDLATFGIDLTNVNTITIGIGAKNAPSPSGGTGTMYFDDIRLIR